MNYAKMIQFDTGNWDGIQSTIFLSGCTFNCEECFNKDAQDFNYGKKLDPEAIRTFIDMAKDPKVDGICILGGEPLQQDLVELYAFIFALRMQVGKPIHLWSGYTIEEIFECDDRWYAVALCDTLVDGRFEILKKDLSLKYKGSSNQRVIDIKKTINKGKIWEVRE